MAAKRRIEFIDIAKGIAIFLVVWGHTATNDELVSADVGLLYKVLYSLHMPLFFFLSGLSMSTKPLRMWDEWRVFLRKTILSVAVPFFIWALIYCTFNYKNVAWILYGSWQALGNAATLTSLWYLSCLFVARIFVELLISYVGKKLWWPIAIVMLAVGVFMPRLSIGYPWCFDIAFVASGCIMLGVLLRKPLIELSVQKIWMLVMLMIASIAIYVATVFIDGDNFIIMMMCKSQYGTGIGPFIRAVTGGFTVLLLAMILRELAEETLTNGQIRPFMYIGLYTMGIFLLHKPFMQEVIIPVMTTLTGSFMSEWLIRFISAVIALLLCLPVCNVIKHYIPELIGINRN